MRRAKTCYRAAGAIDSLEYSLVEAQNDLEHAALTGGADEAGERAIKQIQLARLALVKARSSLGAVLKETDARAR